MWRITGDGEMVTLDQDEEGGDDQLGVPGPQPRAEVGVQAVQLAAQRVHVVPGQQRQGGVLLLSSNSIREYILDLSIKCQGLPEARVEVDEGQGEAGEAEDGLDGGHRVEDSLPQEPPHQKHLPHLPTWIAYRWHQVLHSPPSSHHSHLEYLDDDQQKASTPHNVLGKIS